MTSSDSISMRIAAAIDADFEKRVEAFSAYKFARTESDVWYPPTTIADDPAPKWLAVVRAENLERLKATTAALVKLGESPPTTYRGEPLV